MARFGINPEKTLGVSIPNLRKLAKEIGKDHSLAQQLWDSGVHEARILASMVDDSDQVTKKQMDAWIKDFDSWDVCDQCCMNLFDKTPMAWEKAVEWTKCEKEFEKRAGFALIACLAWHDRKAPDKKFLVFLPAIKREAHDDRNYVKKAINWALRNIGKRNLNLNRKAIKTAKEIQKIDSKSARWVASDAIRELTSKAVQERLQKREE
ncbi:MAG: DNA alkylation repair protein [Candidatus Methanofastidiosia archaeon]